MKKTILLILGLFAGIFSALAQKDTVDVIAYWQVGDKYRFNVEESQYKILNGTDTTDLQRTTHILTLEVVDATDSTYRVRAFTDNYQFSNSSQDALTEEITRRFGNVPYEFETDECGSFKRLIISDEEIEAIYPLLDEMVDKTANKQGMDAVARNSMKQMVRTMFPKERIRNLYADEFTPLFEFHGMWILPGTEVPYETKVPSAYGDGNIIRMDGRFWVDEELSDDYSAVIRQEEVANEEDMQKVVVGILGKAFGALTESLDDEDKDELDAALANMEIKLTKDSVVEIHLETGWPLQYAIDTVTDVRSGDTQQIQASSKSIRIILDDEDE